MRHEIILDDKAREEIEHLHDYIADRAGAAVAWNYFGGLRRFLQGLSEFPERGTVREGPFPGLRRIGYRRSTSIAVVVNADRVCGVGIFHGGRLVDDKLLLTRL